MEALLRMSTATQTMEQLKLIRSKAVNATRNSHDMVFKTRTVECDHAFQITLNYGLEPGPWAVIGLNSTEYCFGYLPRK